MGMPVDGAAADARDAVLRVMTGLELSEADWSAVERELGRIEAALAADDRNALVDATVALELVSGREWIGDSSEAPPRVRLLAVRILDRLGSDVPQPLDGEGQCRLVVEGVKVDQDGDEIFVLLRESEGRRRSLPIVVTKEAATEIVYARDGINARSPHEIVCDVLRVLGGRLDQACITGVSNESVFSAAVTINGVDIEVRARDAVILALRTGAPLCATEQVLQKIGLDIPDD